MFTSTHEINIMEGIKDYTWCFFVCCSKTNSLMEAHNEKNISIRSCQYGKYLLCK